MPGSDVQPQRARRRTAALAASALGVLLLGLAAAEPAPAQKPRETDWRVKAAREKRERGPQLQRPWRRLKTPHFELFGDASERQMQTVATSLESLRSFLDQMATGDVKAPVPTFVYVFRNRKSYAPYEPRGADGKPRGFIGYFLRGSHANYLVIDGSRRDQVGTIARHEYTHFFASYRLPPLPLWLHEGLAEFYQTFDVEKGHVHVGKVVPHHLEWLKQNRPPPLLELFSVDHGSPAYNEAARQGSFYAQSWLLVHYLFMEVEDGRGRLAHFLRLQNRLSPSEAFQRAFEMTPEALEAELGRYLRSGRFTYRRSAVPAGASAQRFATRSMSTSEALARLGELLALQGVGRSRSAEAHLRAALKLDPDEVRGHVGLALVQLHAGAWGDPELMARHGGEARRLAPADPSIAFLDTLARARRGDPPASLREDAAALVNHSPRFLAAWRLVAWTWAGERERLADAIEIFDRARRLFPGEPSYVRHLHRLYRLDGRTEEAEGLSARLYRSALSTSALPEDLDPPPLP